jgi:hypothetical protein
MLSALGIWALALRVFLVMPTLADFATHNERADLAPLDRLSNITRGYLDTAANDFRGMHQLVKLYDDAEKFLTISDNYLEGCEYEKRGWRSNNDASAKQTCTPSPTERSDYDIVHKTQEIADAIRNEIPEYVGATHSLLETTHKELTSLLEQQKALQNSDKWHESWNLTWHYKKEVRDTYLRIDLLSAHVKLLRRAIGNSADKLPHFQNPEFNHYIDAFERRGNPHIWGYEIRSDLLNKKKANLEPWLEGAIENVDSVLRLLEGTQVALDKISSSKRYDIFRSLVTGFGIRDLEADIAVVKELISLAVRESRRLRASGDKVLRNAIRHISLG